MQKEKKITRLVNECKAPLLFTIPLNEYDDEVKKERNREGYLKMQQLGKKAKLLQQKLEDLTTRHSALLHSASQIIAISSHMYNAFVQRKESDPTSNSGFAES